MTVEKACGYIREALEEMGFTVRYSPVTNSWYASPPSFGTPENVYRAAGELLLAIDSLDPMGTTYKGEG